MLLPKPSDLPAAPVHQQILDIRTQFHPITLDLGDYDAVPAEAGECEIPGGAIYDALIARCALKIQADIIYTWNLKHFSRLGPAVTQRLRLP